MRQYLLKNLFLSSLLTFLMYACAPTAAYQLQGKVRLTEKEITHFIPDTGSLLFKAKIDIYSKHYSGLIILKQTDSLRAHVTFVTEVGMKMFDFEIYEHTLKLSYIFDPLNQAKLIQLLSSDLELLLLQNAYTKSASVYEKSERYCYVIKEKLKSYYLVNKSHHIEHIRVKGLIIKKIKVDYTYKNEQTLEQIYLKHKGFFPLKMKLIVLTKEIQ